jgi:hypothetical protein
VFFNFIELSKSNNEQRSKYFFPFYGIHMALADAFSMWILFCFMLILQTKIKLNINAAFW